MSAKHNQPTPECKFGTFLLQRTISLDSAQKQPPLRIAYRIIRPSLLNNASPTVAPLIFIHGGPSLPSEYLTSLAHHITNRTIIFYDQLGCGWSSIPQQNEWYGVGNMSHDLRELLYHLKDVWKVEKFHLLGHSLGGAIGYEFLKKELDLQYGSIASGGSIPQCLSLILSNASTNFELSSSEQTRMFTEYNLQHLQTQMPFKQKHQTKKLSIHDQFFQTHICRTSTKPADLVSSLSRRGKDWSANDYSVTPVSEMAVSGNNFPPVLIIRGQYDFVTEACTQGWKDIFALMKNKLSEVILEDCAHYPHFEQPEKYSQCIELFCFNAES